MSCFKSGRYFCTKSGHVYSRANRNGKSGLLPKTKARRLIGGKSGDLKNPYHLIQICNYPSKKLYATAHQIVYLYFNGLYNPSLEINHKDGNKYNNSLKNIELVTKSQNEKHANRTGLKDFKGEKSGTPKLKNKDVLEIRSAYSTGKFTHSEIAKKYGVDRRTIGAIVLRRNWAHI
jgi:HNH endonuclease